MSDSAAPAIPTLSRMGESSPRSRNVDKYHSSGSCCTLSLNVRQFSCSIHGPTTMNPQPSKDGRSLITIDGAKTRRMASGKRHNGVLMFLYRHVYMARHIRRGLLCTIVGEDEKKNGGEQGREPRTKGRRERKGDRIKTSRKKHC